MFGRQRLHSLIRHGIRLKSGQKLGRHISVWRQRRHLAELPDHLLEDIGLSRAEAEAEARRRIWDFK